MFGSIHFVREYAPKYLDEGKLDRFDSLKRSCQSDVDFSKSEVKKGLAVVALFSGVLAVMGHNPSIVQTWWGTAIVLYSLISVMGGLMLAVVCFTWVIDGWRKLAICNRELEKRKEVKL